MRKAVILLMMLLWVIVTSLGQNKPLERKQKPKLIESLDSLNNSLDRLKTVLDESN